LLIEEMAVLWYFAHPTEKHVRAFREARWVTHSTLEVEENVFSLYAFMY